MAYIKFFNCETLEKLNASLDSGKISQNDLVFISGTKQIWTQGTTYNCPYTAEEVTNLIDQSEGNTINLINALKAVATTSTDGLMSAADKAKLDSLIIDSSLSSTSTNPVQNKIIKAALDEKSDSDHVHSYAGSSSAGGAANSVKSSMTIKVNNGSTEGTNKYTFNGSSAKTLDIKAGTNVSLTTASGSVTINATDTTYEEATTSKAGLMSAADKTRLEGLVSTGGEPNQNAFSTFKVGSTNIEADNIVDVIEFAAGNNITITPDATNDKITISATDTTYGLASSNSSGLMSSGHFSKLEGIEEGANKYTHPTYTAKTSGLYKITVNGNGHISAATDVVKDDITALGIPAQDTTYSNASASSAGLMSADDFSKLSGIEVGAQVNTVTGVKGSSESTYRTGNINITKANVGLGNVTNESKTTMFTSPAFTGTPTAPTANAGTNTTQVATTAFVQSEIDSKIAAADAMIFKGTIGTNGTITELPASHSVGWTYKVITAGTYAGQICEVGDMIVCLTKGTTANNAHWTVIQNNIDGAVTGPSSSVDSRVAIFNGTTGKVIKDSGFTIAKSVPSDAKFTDTDTKVTAVDNHYTPSTNNNTTSSASGGTLTDIANSSSGVQVVTGVTKDAAGHVTGVTSVALKSTNTTYGSLTKSDATTGTATTGKLISAKVLHDKIVEMLPAGATGGQDGFMSAADKAKLDGISESADAVSFSQKLTSGTEVGTITINGTDTKLYAPTNTDTTYSFSSGTNKFTVTPSNGSAYDVTVTPSIASNVTYSGTLTSGQVAIYDGTAGKIKASGFTIAKSVPSDAKFTDTTYTAGSGITLTSGAFGHTNSITEGTVGTSSATNGKTIAIPYITYDANGHIVSTGTHTHTVSGFLTDETYKGTVTSVTLTQGTGITVSDSGTAISSSGTRTITLNTAKTDTIGGIKIAKDNASYAVTGATSSISTDITSGKFYGVEIDKNDKAFVYVPWTDTKVTAVGNHYTPSGGTTTSASGGALTDITNSSTGVQVVTGVTIDAAGHITGVTSKALKSVNTNTEYSAGTGITLTSGAFSLATSGVTAGSYGPSSNVTGSHGATMSVPYITVDEYGRVTSISNKTYTAEDKDTTYSKATISTDGLMSSDDKAKLDAMGSIVTSTKTLTVGTTWLDTGITTHDLSGTGTYIVQVALNDSKAAYNGYWSGIMSAYDGTTNATASDEIVLHCNSHSNSTQIYLRTIRQSGSTAYTKLQISASASIASTSYTFKFRKLI